MITYDRLASLPADEPVVFVDFAGDSGLRARLHHHFAERMKYSAQIGLTHRNTADDDPELPGAKPKLFFAPDHIRKRAREWGPGGVDARFSAAWAEFAPTLDGWLKVVETKGADSVRQVYLDTLAGRIPPDQGRMLSLAG